VARVEAGPGLAHLPYDDVRTGEGVEGTQQRGGIRVAVLGGKTDHLA
jgi:hypothetical protein